LDVRPSYPDGGGNKAFGCLFEKRRLCGAFALLFRTSWFLIANQVIIPFFTAAVRQQQ